MWQTQPAAGHVINRTGSSMASEARRSGAPVPVQGLGAQFLLLPAAATVLLQPVDNEKMHESHMLLCTHRLAPQDSSFWESHVKARCLLTCAAHNAAGGSCWDVNTQPLEH